MPLAKKHKQKLYVTAENIALALSQKNILNLAQDYIKVLNNISTTHYSIGVDKALVALSLPTHLIFRFILDTYKKQFTDNEKSALKSIFHSIRLKLKDIPSAKIKAICRNNDGSPP